LGATGNLMPVSKDRCLFRKKEIKKENRKRTGAEAGPPEGTQNPNRPQNPVFMGKKRKGGDGKKKQGRRWKKSGSKNTISLRFGAGWIEGKKKAPVKPPGGTRPQKENRKVLSKCHLKVKRKRDGRKPGEKTY